MIRIPAAGFEQIRVRCSTYTAGDSIAVRLVASVAGTSSGSLSTNDGSFAKENGGNLAAAKSDLDSIVTNTAKIPSSPAQEAGNLATIATNTGRLPVQGQATKTGSMPVTLASDQGTLPTLDANSAAIKADLDSMLTNTNKIPASPAMENGNLATVATQVTTTATNTGTAATVLGGTADAAVVGDNAGTVSGKLRGLLKILNDIWDSANHRVKVDASGATVPVSGSVNVAQLAGVTPKLDNTNELGVSLYGKNAAAGDTALYVDSSGRLYVNVNSLPALSAGSALIGGVNIFDSAGVNKLAVDASGRLTLAPNQSVNVAQYNGVNVGPTNPQITQAQIDALIANGQGYSLTTGKLTTAAALTTGLGLFNNSTAKTILIYRVVMYANGGANISQLNMTTADPALGTTATPVNLKGGGSASVAICSYSNTAVTPAGSVVEVFAHSTNQIWDVLQNGMKLVLPASAATGFAAYISVTGAAAWGCNIYWVEF